MSVEVMSMVFKRYPAGGNERLLALAIADHARPDGTQVYPSVPLLAQMTCQSERTVQRAIHAMLAAGWLLLVRKSSGRRGDTNEYRISPEWLAGGEPVAPPQIPDRRTVKKSTGDRLTPVEPVIHRPAPVDKLSTTGDTHGLSGDTQGLSGDIAVSPNPSLPILTHTPLPPVGTGGDGKTPEPEQPDTVDQKAGWRWRDSFEGVCRRGAKLGMPYSTTALGNAWTDDQLRAHQATYRRMVEAEHEARVEAGPSHAHRRPARHGARAC